MWHLLITLLCLIMVSSTGAATLLPPRIMLLGDSTQSGLALLDTTSQASWRLQRDGGVIVQNFASPGATMADRPHHPGMTHAPVALLAGFFGMDGLIVTLGVNDFQDNISINTFGAAYASLLAATPAGTKVVCITPLWSSQLEGRVNALGKTLEDYRVAIRFVCAVSGKPTLEGTTAIPHAPEYFTDGLHPSDLGHQAMGTWYVAQLSALGWLPP